MICYVTACTTQHTENKIKIKQYKLNCTKQHWAVNNPCNNISHFCLEVLPTPVDLHLPSVRSQLLLEGD